MIEILKYALSDGTTPFVKRFKSLKDTRPKAVNFGDRKSVGDGAHELRVCYSRQGDAVAVLYVRWR